MVLSLIGTYWSWATAPLLVLLTMAGTGARHSRG